jgi:hypothetical protein
MPNGWRRAFHKRQSAIACVKQENLRTAFMRLVLSAWLPEYCGNRSNLFVQRRSRVFSPFISCGSVFGSCRKRRGRSRLRFRSSWPSLQIWKRPICAFRWSGSLSDRDGEGYRLSAIVRRAHDVSPESGGYGRVAPVDACRPRAASTLLGCTQKLQRQTATWRFERPRLHGFARSTDSHRGRTKTRLFAPRRTHRSDRTWRAGDNSPCRYGFPRAT